MEHIVDVEDISIKVPWGHIVGKWWGPRQIRPVVVLHGWQDNSGSFDTLIPLLPRHVSYLAIDLPGHGLSSHLPNGMLYSQLHKKFNWDKISLCGHSMGAIVSFFYASSFINECDMVVALDALVPIEANDYLVLDSLRFGFDEVYVADQRNIAGTEPPSYAYDMVVEKLLNGVFSSYTKEALPYLLLRGMKESKSNPNKYFFTRDNRIKARTAFIVQEKESVVEMASRITAPYCYLKALLYPFNAEGALGSYMDDILQAMKNCNSKFEVHGVDGDHHVHLTEPLKIWKMDSDTEKNTKPKRRQTRQTSRQKSVSVSPSDPTIDETILDYVVVFDKKKTKSPVWKHFGKLFNNAAGNEVDNGYNFCNLCLKHEHSEFRSQLLFNDVRLKPRHQIRSVHRFKCGTSTTNLANHLSVVHKLSDKDQMSYSDASKKLTEYFECNKSSGSPTNRNYLLSRRLAILCARSLISYNAVASNSVAFNDFLKSYNIVLNQGPDRTTLTRSALSDVYFEMVPVIKEIVKDIKYCAITLDLWTDSYKRNGYITFNLSYIDDNFELHNINLKTGLMSIKHGAVEIGEEYFRTLKTFGIENVSIYVVGDKGANIVKFINDENLDHQHCLGHGIHNLVNVDGFAAVPEISDVLKKIKKVVKKLRFRNVQLEREDKNVRNDILARIDELDEELLNDLFDGSEDEEGFSAAERLPLALSTLLNDESDPMKTIDKGR